MRRTMTTSSVFAAALLAFGALSPALARDSKVDGYAAIVNDRVITVGDVMSSSALAQKQLMELFEGYELQTKLQGVYTNTLNRLIEQALILEDYKAQGGNLPDRFVDDQTSTIINDKFHNDRAAFLEALAQERMTMDEWREQTKNRVIVSLMNRKEVMERVQVSPRAIRDLYDARVEQFRIPEQVHVRMIVLHQGATASDQKVKREEAEKVRARLLKGDDFADVAKSVSEGAKASEGGDNGWMKPDDFRKEIADAIKTVEPGRISDVIEAGDEFYIIKVEERKAASIRPFEEVRGQLEEEVRQSEEDRLYKDWMKRLRNKYYVNILKP